MHDGDELSTILPVDPSPDSGRTPVERGHRHAARRDSRREHQRLRQRKRIRGRRAVVMLVALALVGGAGFGAYSALAPLVAQLRAPDDFTGQGTGRVQVTVEEGASATAIGRTLAEQGVVKSVGAFVDAAADNSRATSIQPGTYALRQRMSGAAAVTLLLDPKARQANRVTLREGLRQDQVVALLAKASGRPAAEYTAALKRPASIGLPAQARGRAEGWLFPDTYELAPEASASEQLAMLVTRTTKLLDELEVPADQRQELLIKASIVQGEGGSPDEFGRVARVIENRLADKVRNGRRLQMDSTVNYGSGKNGIFTGKADREDAGNPYNTYANPGLPVGPIGNPGRAAIEATLAPPPGDWLYFVVVNLDTRETKFSTNAADHQKYIRELQAWYAENR